MTNFRVAYIDEDGEPLAVFLDSGAEAGPGRLIVYSRVGEHSEADIDYLRRLPLASEATYQQLHAYLSRRYAGDPGQPLTLTIDQEGVPR